MGRDRQLSAHTLQYCGGSKPKAAKLLGISKDILEVALYEKNPNRALPEKFSQRIHDNFTKNVAFLDSLTGLMNKTHFISILNDVLKRGDEGAVLYLDLNKFKPVNDTHGHDAGDEVLKVIAERLRANTSRNSVISRLGGDEFAVLLANINSDKAEDVCKRLKTKIAEDIRLSTIDKVVNVGASVGIAHFPKDASNAEDLLKKADKQMYQTKKSR